MKLKQQPQDFCVTEISDHPIGPSGRLAIYRLRKEGIDTLTGVRLAAARLRVKTATIRYGGLKDAHAATEQLISVPIGKQWRDGVPKAVTAKEFSLELLGRSDAPVTPQSIAGNAFRITLRHLKKPDVKPMHDAAASMAEYGLPNYYDSQRFGQLRGGADYVGKMLVQGDFEGALKAAIATPARKDRQGIKKIRRTIRDRWGDWEACLERLSKSTERSVVTYLATHPTDFAAAFEKLPRGLRLLLVSAYQSFLWNRVACSLIGEHTLGDEQIPFEHESGELLFYSRLPTDALLKMEVPALRPNTELVEPYAGPYERILASEDVTQEGFRLKGLEATYFPKSSRKLILRPQDFSLSDPTPDTLNPGRLAVELSCTLPSGAYATLVVKRLMS